MEITEILHESLSKRSFRHGTHSLLRRAGARVRVRVRVYVHHLTYLTHIASLLVRHSYCSQTVGHA